MVNLLDALDGFGYKLKDDIETVECTEVKPLSFKVKNVISGDELSAKVYDEMGNKVTNEVFSFVNNLVLLGEADEVIRNSLYHHTVTQKYAILSLNVNNPASVFLSIKPDGLCSWRLLVFVYSYYRHQRTNNNIDDSNPLNDFYPEINIDDEFQRDYFICSIAQMINSVTSAEFRAEIVYKWNKVLAIIDSKGKIKFTLFRVYI
jgi:hypothetical protein